MALCSVAAIAAISVSLLGALGVSAQAAEIVVFSTVAAKSVLEEIAPAFERDSKHKLTLRFATAAELKTEIERGAPFDVALLTAGAVDDLIKQGRLTQASRVNVARSGVGIAVTKGTATPPITTGATEAGVAIREVDCILRAGCNGADHEDNIRALWNHRRDERKDRCGYQDNCIGGRGSGSGRNGLYADQRDSRYA